MKKEMKKKLALITVLSAALLLTGCKSSDYKKAAEALAQGNYEEASAVFTELGEYKDSAEKLLECRYQIADGKLTGGDFAEALQEFTDLGEYKDSAGKVPECKYGIAEEKLTGKDFEGALKAFQELGNFKDSAEKIIECKYDIAKDKLSTGDYEKAVKGFTELGEYSDAQALLSEATDQWIESRLPGTYETGKVDYTDIFLGGVDSSFGDGDFNPADLLDGVELGINTIVTFTEDGKIIQSVDEESFRADMEAVKEALSKGLLSYFARSLEEELAAQGISLEIMYTLLGVDNLEDLFASVSGLSIGDLLDASFEEAFSAIPMEDEGTYEVKDGQIIATDSKGDTDIFLMDLETGSLTVPGEDAPEMLQGMYPMEFTKVK